MSARDVYEQLRKEIVTGHLAPGSPVREVAVAERYGVSRTPVREALRRLEHDRLLEASTRGLAVRRPSPEEVIQVYDARILLEGAAAEQAAVSRGEADIALLEGLLARDLALEDPSPEVRAKTNIEFHETLWRATHNPILVDLLQRLNLHLIHTPTTTLASPGRWEHALNEHRDLIAAIRDGDGQRAGEVARQHMRRARDIRLAMWRTATPTTGTTGD
jgi:DNA-binding GntR family transcriptional regulator